MMSHLCNRCVRELLILARTWFAFGLPSKPGVTKIEQSFVLECPEQLYWDVILCFGDEHSRHLTVDDLRRLLVSKIVR
jgi:hypothetical protein